MDVQASPGFHACVFVLTTYKFTSLCVHMYFK